MHIVTYVDDHKAYVCIMIFLQVDVENFDDLLLKHNQAHVLKYFNKARNKLECDDLLGLGDKKTIKRLACTCISLNTVVLNSRD